MNRLAFALAALSALAVGAVAMAATPNPHVSPTAASGATATLYPTGSPSAGATSSPAAAGKAAAKAAPSPSAKSSWQAQVAPVTVSGTANVQQQADGTGIITLQLTGLVNEQPWTVDVQGGTIERPQENVRIALKTNDEVQRVAPDTIQVHLTKQEMTGFTQAIQSKGVVMFVSDGTRLSAAVFPAQ
jgi:hypothetical protein